MWWQTVGILLFLAIFARPECVLRDYGNGGHVCVCNATHCDDIESVEGFPPRQYLLYTSTKDGQRYTLTKRNFGLKVKTRSIVLTVNSSLTYQTVNGFGVALTDSAGLNVASLSLATQEKLLQTAFSPLGNAYTLARLPMGGTDFSTRPYTYDDIEYDVALKNFTLAYEDHQYKIPFAKKAKELSGDKVRFVTTAWTAPPWMKTNLDYTGFGFLKDEYYRAWAHYFLRFFEEYQKEGIEFWAVSTGNEPLNGAIPFFPFNCMGWTPKGQITWIAEHLGPELERSAFNKTLILALDDQRILLPWWPDLIFNNEKVNQYVSGIALHWYWDTVAPALLLDKTHESFPDKFLISTEACFVPKLWEKRVVILGSWSRGEQYAENIIEDMNHWMTGWIDWNLALDENGGPNWANNFADAAIIVNATSDEFYKQPMFYALGHFSHFVPQGSVRIDLQGAIRGLKAIAFKTPDEYVVLILLNKKNCDVAVSLTGGPRGVANFVAPRRSITTLVYRDKKVPLFKTFHEY